MPLSPRQLVLVRNAIARDEPRAAIARRHGITPRQVWNIEFGRSWGPDKRKVGRPKLPARERKKRERLRRAARARRMVEPQPDTLPQPDSPRELVQR